MKKTLAALLCLTALCAFSENEPPQIELFRALGNEAYEKMWKQPAEWREKGPDQKTFDAWQDARVEQWGMDILKRYTDLIERYPDTPYVYMWQMKQPAQILWWHLDRLKKPEDQKYLEAWRGKWLGDNVIGRRFYTSRLDELTKQFPDIADVEKIARTLMSEFPMRREPHRAFLSIARRKSPATREAALQEILKTTNTAETVKAYLQGKAGPQKREDEPYDYAGGLEDKRMEIDYYEIRHAQLFNLAHESMGYLEAEEKVNRALIMEFPELDSPYYEIMASIGERGIGAMRAWTLEVVNGSASDAIKALVQNDYLSRLLRINDETFDAVVFKNSPPAPEEEKAWLEKHEPQWRTNLVGLADFMEGRLKGDDMEWARHRTITLLDVLSRETVDPEYRQHLADLAAKWLAVPGWDEEERMELRSIQLYTQATKGGTAIRGYIHDVYPPELSDKVIRTLIKEFQSRPTKKLLNLAKRKDLLDRATLLTFIDGKAPDSFKKELRNELAQMDRVGQPFELKGTAVDGRELDVQQMKGKVILVDFWATWCGPCLAEVPRIKSLYEKYHAQGFEVIGLSLDEKQEKLKTFLEEQPTLWPQVWFKSWERFGINSIPTLWLVDKQGILRDVNARKDLEKKITKLLAEQTIKKKMP